MKWKCLRFISVGIPFAFSISLWSGFEYKQRGMAHAFFVPINILFISDTFWQSEGVILQREITNILNLHYMSITDGYKQQIANYRARIITLRTQIQKIKEEKKRRMEALSKSVKTASTPMSKESYRKSKVMEAANYDKRIEAAKRSIESIKSIIEQYKKKL